MLFQQSRGFRQALGEGSCGLELVKGNSPAMLPMQGEPSHNSCCRDHTEQRAIGNAMKAPK